MKEWRYVLFASILFGFLTGCGAHRANRNLIVLLPDSDGKSGIITVTTKGGSQIIDRPGYAVEVEDINQPPAAPKPVTEGEITDVFAPALSALPDPVRRVTLFILYFERDSTKLTHKSADLLMEMQRTIKSLNSDEVYLVGHTDLVGTESYNDRLSAKRANYIRDLLISSGIKPNSLFISFYGKARPLVPTRDEVPEPRNRRVEVIIR
ncbi:MAG TPA: OmpA family protein [Thermodesulfobacteriota bacterium]|nr:OmpA family protein [Thermodesulfobacteriota bacterium]